MERQHKLVIDILKLLSAQGILDRVLLIGSWCASFYKEYFSAVDYHPRLRTRDIDFLLPARTRFPKKVDLAELLAPLGFELEFYGNGYMKLESDELALEFLAPETGPSKEKPHSVPELHFNAQPLRHVAMLWRNPVIVSVGGIRVQLPHPADYCLQKLLISGKRRGAGKREKDRATAFLVIEALIEMGDLKSLRDAFEDLTASERRAVEKILRSSGYWDAIQKA